MNKGEKIEMIPIAGQVEYLLCEESWTKMSCMFGLQQVIHNSFLKHTRTNLIRDVVSRRRGAIFLALRTRLTHPAYTLSWFKLQWSKDLNSWRLSPLIQYCSTVQRIHTCIVRVARIHMNPYMFKDWELGCHIVFGVGSVNKAWVDIFNIEMKRSSLA